MVCFAWLNEMRNEGGKIMSRIFARLTLAILALSVAVPLLCACHTVSGAGQDISSTGQAIDKAAKKTTP
jgi:predicted small secreted protein